ncbi:9825_t:CDS:2 [Funneliformis geosporum]|uniref:9825_t:CDS:1 n=1 Tax=Funneliformis geosporum TaxID=1117311 RepID=A0A9W4WW06_9GLOM|nr:9825_t:CDS:2 [Funneliformis geosporum]
MVHISTEKTFKNIYPCSRRAQLKIYQSQNVSEYLQGEMSVI